MSGSELITSIFVPNQNCGHFFLLEVNYRRLEAGFKMPRRVVFYFGCSNHFLLKHSRCQKWTSCLNSVFELFVLGCKLFKLLTAFNSTDIHFAVDIPCLRLLCDAEARDFQFSALDFFDFCWARNHEQFLLTDCSAMLSNPFVVS